MSNKTLYEYDSVRKVLIRIPFDRPPEIFYKGDRSWRHFTEQDDQYSRAIYLGQGCWERLDSISEEDAEKLIAEWVRIEL